MSIRRLSIVAFPESRLVSTARCLEHDLMASGRTTEGAVDALLKMVRAHIDYDRRHGGGSARHARCDESRRHAGSAASGDQARAERSDRLIGVGDSHTDVATQRAARFALTFINTDSSVDSSLNSATLPLTA